MKRPFYKTWWFIAIMAIVILFIFGAIGSMYEGDKPKEEISKDVPKEEEVENEAQDEEETKNVQDEKKETQELENEDEAIDYNEEDLEMVNEDEISELDELKGEIISKSDKDFKTLTNSSPSEVNNDATGNWRVITISESIPIEEYALSYNEEYMNEQEIHFIVNSNDNTTTVINKQAGLIFLDINEYVEKEEEDGEVLGNGNTLAKYIIYPDGDIEKIK